MSVCNEPAVFSDNLFAGKVFVVTGGGQGIGKAITASLRSLSATVVVIEHPECRDKLPNDHSVYIDLNNSDALHGCILRIVDDYGRCDALINNARVGSRTEPLQETAQNIERCFGVGLTAPTLLSQQLIQYAKQHTGTSRSIINISSTAARAVSAESTAYHAGKAALESLTRYLAVYAGKCNVRVNAVAPGFIVKDQHLERFNSEVNLQYRSAALAAHALPCVGNELDVANAVAFLLSDAAAFITGHTLAVDGGLTLRDGFATLVSASNGSAG